MSLITGSYPSFVGGVSQQDASVRGQTQLAEAVNAWLHAAMGTGKRPPAEFVKVLASDADPMAHFHSVLRDVSERYLVVVGNRSVRVFNHETGYEYDVRMADNAFLDYLATDKQPWSVFRTATTADSTYILNTERVAKMTDLKTPGWITGSVDAFADLPKDEDNLPVPLGVIYEVMGAAGNDYDNFYVQRSGAGVWKEVARPGSLCEFDMKTMPHVLKRIPDAVHGDGMYFAFGPQTWDLRLAGDDRTIAAPSFINQRINDVFFHQGRLGLLTAEDCALSELDHPFNFWRTTTQSLLDTDLIDFSVQTEGVARLQFALPYRSSLLLFGDRMNFQMTATPYLSPKTAKVDPLVNYSCSRFVRPTLLGDSLYFASDTGAYTAIREYFVDDVSVTGDAADVTAHVPRYVPTRVRAMASGPEADMLFVASESGPSQLYAYSVRWSGDEKAQSAWSRWTISGVGRVSHLRVIDDYLYVAAQAAGGGVEMLRISLSLTSADADLLEDYSFLLDRLVVVEPNYYAFGNYTDINLPYVLESLENYTVVKTDDWETPGELLDLTGAALLNGGTTIRLQGNFAEGRLAMGLNYEQMLELSRPYLRERQGGSVLVGRLQVRDITIAYRNAAFFEVAVELTGRSLPPQTYLAGHAGTFTARTLGDEMFRLGSPTFHTGERRFPVLSRSDQCRVRLINRLPYQCWFQSAQYRALFSSRSQV